MAFSLRGSERLWKGRHTYRQGRLNVWVRRRSYRYNKWVDYQKTVAEGHALREKWYRLYEDADVKVDKWIGLRDTASYWLRRRRKEIAAKRKTLSTYFDVVEFDTHDGTPVPEMAYDGLRDLCVGVLEPMRAEFGPATIVSGHRHAIYNRGRGGASASYHIYDYAGRGGRQVAADVIFARGTPAQWASLARGLGVGGVGQYDRSGFVHVDNGPPRAWWG